MSGELNDRERDLLTRAADNPMDLFQGKTIGWLEDFIRITIPPPPVPATSGTGTTGLSAAFYVPGDTKIVMKDLSAQTGVYVYSDASGDWLYCNGAQASQTTYAGLYAFYGANAWGTDAGGNFFLPDTRGRALYLCGTHADTDLGDADGIALASRRPKHQHTFSGVSISGFTSSDSAGTPSGTVGITDPGHAHYIPSVFDQTNGEGPPQRGLSGDYRTTFNATSSATTGITAAFTGSALSAHAHSFSGTSSGGTAGSGMALDAPPYLFIGSQVVRF